MTVEREHTVKTSVGSQFAHLDVVVLIRSINLRDDSLRIQNLKSGDDICEFVRTEVGAGETC